MKNRPGRIRGGAEGAEEERRRAKFPNLRNNQMNGRRFFRWLDGGIENGPISQFAVAGEDRAFWQENTYVVQRREALGKALEQEGIDPKALWKNTFTLDVEGFAATTFTLDELLYLHRAGFNARAYNAVVFGNFMTANERAAMKAASINEAQDTAWQPNPGRAYELEQTALKRYEAAMKMLEEFFAKDENAKFRAVERIIGDDYDANYSRLSEHVALEFNQELGSEKYYLPLGRMQSTGQDLEQQIIEEILGSTGFGLSPNKGFTLARIDIAPWHQTPVRLGLYKTWDNMVVKQEHLMAYGPYLREMRQIFEGQGSGKLQEDIQNRYTSAANDYIRKWISDLAAPAGTAEYSALDDVTRIIRGHYPAAVLGFRLSSVIKQIITSPPGFIQYIGLGRYLAAIGEFIGNKDIQKFINEKSIFMKTRKYDPAIEFVNQIEKMYLPGKLGKGESVLVQIEKTGMKPLEFIDYVMVAPGWLGAYRQKVAELNKTSPNMDTELLDREAIRYADQVVRDTQPSSRIADLAPMLRGEKSPLKQIFLQFQTPMSVIFQNLAFDVPNKIKHGHAGTALLIVGAYALAAAVAGAMGEDEEGEKLNPKYRALDAATGLLESIPVLGGGLAYGVESLARTGKIRQSTFRPYPILDSATAAVNAAIDENWGKATWNAIEAFAYAGGLPVGLEREIRKAIKERNLALILGIN
jgi:hypothetical protein